MSETDNPIVRAPINGPQGSYKNISDLLRELLAQGFRPAEPTLMYPDANQVGQHHYDGSPPLLSFGKPIRPQSAPYQSPPQTQESPKSTESPERQD